jgi:hypothetical protein
MGPDGPEAYLDLDAASELTAYSRVAVSLDDTTGRRLATLYDDTLPAVQRLQRLPAGSYRGGTARILIEGFRGMRLAYREARLYDGRTQRLLALEIQRFEDSGAVSATRPPGTHAPFLSSSPRDTFVSIRDTVPLQAMAADADGDLAAYAWDCDGDGRAEDSARIYGFSAPIRFGARYAAPALHACELRIWDVAGRMAQARVGIDVRLDPPWADAGRDTTVAAGAPILLHARGEDGIGPILTRSWSIGGEPFKPVPQIETSIIAPKTPGDLICILRVTDSDSLAAYDTLVVHVEAPAAP